jgi:flagellar motor component MotA
MSWNAVIGGILTMSLVFLACVLGAPWWVFFDIPTFTLVFLLPVIFLVQAHGVAGFEATVQTVRCWLGSEDSPPQHLDNACCVVETIANATIKAAHIAVLIGSIQILQFTHTNNLDTLGPAMAVAVLSYFYAHCINFVLWGPLSRWLRQHAEVNATNTETQVGGAPV